MRSLVFGLVLTLLLAACGTDGGGDDAITEGDVATAEGDAAAADDADDAEVLQVANLLPQSGPASYYGDSLRVAWDYVFEQVNAEGGIEVGGQRYELEHVVRDDEQSPDTATTAARRLLDDGIEFIVGPLGSGPTSAVQPIMAESDAVWILATATVEGPTENPNVFRTASTLDAYNEVALQWYANQDDMEDVAILTDEQHTGLMSVTDNAIAGIEDHGGEAVMNETFQLGDTDFRAPISAALERDMDLFFQRGYPAEILAGLQQLKELGGEDIPVLWNAAFANDEILGMVEGDCELLDGVYQAGPLMNLDPYLAEGNPLAEEIEAGVPMHGTFTASGYDAAVIFVEALRRADDATPEAVIESLEQLTVDDVQEVTLQEYFPQADGLLFEDRNVSVATAVTQWNAESCSWEIVEILEQ